MSEVGVGGRGECRGQQQHHTHPREGSATPRRQRATAVARATSRARPPAASNDSSGEEETAEGSSGKSIAS